MVEIIRAGGLLMLPIILCSIVAIAIVIERFWTLSSSRITPKYVLAQVWTWLKNNQLDSTKLRELRLSSPLGQILAAGLLTSKYGRAAMIDSIELAAAQVVHDLERYLNTLGTIAAITPLLGLLGTVVGMITVFGNIDINGSANADLLAAGISEALITTAFGLIIAVPAIVFYRFFEQKTINLMSVLQANTSLFLDFLYKK